MFPWNASDVVAWLSYVNSSCLFFCEFSVEDGDIEAGKASASLRRKKHISGRRGKRAMSDEGAAPERHEEGRWGRWKETG